MRRLRFAAVLAVVALVGAMAIPAGATGTEGCSPGFWKNHTSMWPDDYTPGSDFYSNVLDWPEPDEPTMLAALSGGGGPGLAGATTILSRAATAAFLNAASEGLAYPLHRDEIRAMLWDVWGDRAAMLELYEYLDDLNNLGAGYCGT